jgi:hypothetical protein
MSDSGDGNGAGGTLRECDVGAVGGARGGGAGKIHLSLHSLGAQEGIAALRQGERRFTEFQLRNLEIAKNELIKMLRASEQVL